MDGKHEMMVVRRLAKWGSQALGQPLSLDEVEDVLEVLEAALPDTQPSSQACTVHSGTQGSVRLTQDAQGTHIAIKTVRIMIDKRDTMSSVAYSGILGEVIMSAVKLDPAKHSSALVKAVECMVVAQAAFYAVKQGELTVVTVYEQWDGDLLRLAYCPPDKTGVPWSGWLSQATKEVPVYRLITMLAKVAESLQAVHDAGLLYTDVKPDNVLYRQQAGGDIQLAFGDLGSLATTDKATGQVKSLYMHTDMYTPPNHRDTPRDCTADVWGLAAMGFTLLAGVGCLGATEDIIAQTWLQGEGMDHQQLMTHLLSSGSSANLHPRLQCLEAQEAWHLGAKQLVSIMTEAASLTPSHRPTAGQVGTRLHELAAQMKAAHPSPEDLLLQLPAHLFTGTTIQAAQSPPTTALHVHPPVTSAAAVPQALSASSRQLFEQQATPRAANWSQRSSESMCAEEEAVQEELQKLLMDVLFDACGRDQSPRGIPAGHADDELVCHLFSPQLETQSDVRPAVKAVSELSCNPHVSIPATDAVMCEAPVTGGEVEKEQGGAKERCKAAADVVCAPSKLFSSSCVCAAQQQEQEEEPAARMRVQPVQQGGGDIPTAALLSSSSSTDVSSWWAESAQGVEEQGPKEQHEGGAVERQRTAASCTPPAADERDGDESAGLRVVMASLGSSSECLASLTTASSDELVASAKHDSSESWGSDDDVHVAVMDQLLGSPESSSAVPPVIASDVDAPALQADSPSSIQSSGAALSAQVSEAEAEAEAEPIRRGGRWLRPKALLRGGWQRVRQGAKLLATKVLEGTVITVGLAITIEW